MWSICLALCLTAATASPYGMTFWSPELDDELTVSQMRTQGGLQDSSTLEVVDNVLPLQRAGGDSLSSIYVQAIRAAANGPAKRGLSRASVSPKDTIKAVTYHTKSGVAPLEGIYGSIYTAPVTIGGQSFQVVIDTGSSDPWVASSTFQCINGDNNAVEDQSFCRFGPLYDPTQSTTFSSIANENFNVSYADGENLNGIMGYETFSIAGITVPQQEFGVVEQALWYGDGVSSGLIGFAYNTLTSAYPGTNASADVKGHQLTYSTLFTSMYQRGLTQPIFSLALSRNTNSAGLLAIGGIPNVQHSPGFSTVPIQAVGISGASKQLVYQFYSIIIDGWAISSSQSAQFNVIGNNNPRKTNLVGNGTQVIVDSGTSLIYAPDDVVAQIAASFNPPAQWDQNEEAYVVSCSATAPLFGVSIAKKIFYVNPVDMVVASYSLCYMSVQPNLGGLTILGDVWMRNVLVVFDVGAEQMRFAAREYYDTPACSGTNCVGTI